MTDASVPPLPGADTPVDADAPPPPERRRAAAAASDALIPQTALEQRAAERARLRTPPHVAPQPPASPAYAPPVYQTAQYAPPAYPQQYAPRYIPPAHPPGYPPQYAPPGYPPQLQPRYVPLAVIPKRPFTRAQRSAALLGSLVGQTMLSLATHFLGGFFAVTSLSYFLQLLGIADVDGMDGLDDGTLMGLISFWTEPTRYVWFVLIALLIAALIAAAGSAVTIIWQRRAGLHAAGGALALGWLTTLVITGSVGSFLWPTTLAAGMGFAVEGSASLTFGSMWGFMITALIVASVLCGLLGMLFGWLFLLAFRVRPTPVDLDAERRSAEAAAEQRARDADAAWLSATR